MLAHGWQSVEWVVAGKQRNSFAAFSVLQRGTQKGKQSVPTRSEFIDEYLW